jgi:hypothetical protein
VLGYQTDLTRVTSFMIAHERSVRTYSEIGVPDSDHALSQYRGDPESIEKVIQINAFHVKLFADLQDKLESTPDGAGRWRRFGGKGCRRVGYPADTTMSNLYPTILDKLEARVDNLSDSTRELGMLSVA